MKSLSIIALCLTTYVCSAQLVEHFDDGNFTSDPVWSGSTSHFIISASQQLQLNNTIAATSYLSTPFAATSLEGFEWEVYAKQSFAASGSNFGRVYLVSNQTNLAGPLNGYYLQLGEAGSLDAVELFRQSGTVHTSVCRAANAGIANAFAIRVKVTHSGANWKLYIDYSGGTTFIEAASGSDGTINSSSFLGVLCTYTIGNANRFFFDDFIAGPPRGDLTPPILQRVEIEPPSSLLLTFSEPIDSASLSDFIAVPELGHPISIGLLQDQKSLKLTFLSPFSNGRQYELHADSVADLAGNLIVPVTATFRHFVPEPAERGDIVFNELFADPSPIIGLPSQEFIELFNQSEKAFYLEGWTLRDLISTAKLPPYYMLPGEYVIITTTAGAANYSIYGQTMGLSDMPTLNNTGDRFTLHDVMGVTLDSVQYALSWYRDEDREQGGYTLERLYPELDTNEPLNWIASESLSGGTPGHQNTVWGRKLDTRPPLVDSLVVVSKRELRIVFNEEMDSSSLIQHQHYSIGNSEYHPHGIVPGRNRVTLLLDRDFINGEDNYLTIDSLFDLAANAIARCQIAFRYFVPGIATPRAVLITEIMADPSPVVLLPEAEFVEIVNHSDVPFDLTDWTLSDATSVAKIPKAIIMPGEFLILTSTSNAPVLTPFGRTLSVTGFPSLSNNGEPLVLKCPNGVTVDSLRYDTSWLRDAVKRDGGWSLERLRVDLKSNWYLNWRASIDSAGGTPGRINSRNGQHPDQEPPRIVSLISTTSHTVNISFSEPVLIPDGTARVTADSLRCKELTLFSPSIVKLAFDREFANGAVHTLEVSGFVDTAMNVMSPEQLKFTYFVPQPVSPKDIVITEIMADPVPVVGLPEVEYVELLNRSANPVRLAGWQLKDAQGSAEFPDEILLPRERGVVTSALSLNRFPPGVRTLPMTGFPSLANDGESLVIMEPTGSVIDSISYDLSWYHSRDKSDGGWSLEMIDPQNPCGDGDNWAASEAVAGGTPGLPNSVDANKPDLSGPRIETVHALQNKLLITFNEKLGKSLAAATIELRPSAGNYSVQFIDRTLRGIKVEFELALVLSTEYEVIVKNVVDCNGNHIEPDFGTTKFALPEDPVPGDVIINEILFNPRTGGVDFIEFFNQSDRYLDINGWQVVRNEEGIQDSQRLVSQSVWRPKSYRVLTEDPEVLKSQYPNGDETTFHRSNLPPMPDEAGSILLTDSKRVGLDSVRYNENMHASMLRDADGVSLERVSPSTGSFEPSNWRSANESAGFATPGLINSSYRALSTDAENQLTITPEIISMTGSVNFALIEYSLQEPGSYVNCKIVDQRGRIMKILAENVSVGAKGFFRWDGDDDHGGPVIPGYYLVHFEWFSVDGIMGVFRRRVVVSPR